MQIRGPLSRGQLDEPQRPRGARVSHDDDDWSAGEGHDGHDEESSLKMMIMLNIIIMISVSRMCSTSSSAPRRPRTRPSPCCTASASTWRGPPHPGRRARHSAWSSARVRRNTVNIFSVLKHILRTVYNENMFAGGTSCQDPGRGYYRWYKEAYVESEIIIDLVGDSKKVSPHWSAAGHVTPVLTSYWPV